MLGGKPRDLGGERPAEPRIDSADDIDAALDKRAYDRGLDVLVGEPGPGQEPYATVGMSHVCSSPTTEAA